MVSEKFIGRLTSTCGPTRAEHREKIGRFFAVADPDGGSRKNFETGDGGRQCVSPVVLYRNCTQRTICLLYRQRGFPAQKIRANRGRLPPPPSWICHWFFVCKSSLIHCNTPRVAFPKRARSQLWMAVWNSQWHNTHKDNKRRSYAVYSSQIAPKSIPLKILGAVFLAINENVEEEIVLPSSQLHRALVYIYRVAQKVSHYHELSLYRIKTCHQG